MFEGWKVLRRTGFLYDSRRMIAVATLFFTTTAIKHQLYIRDMNMEDYGEDHPHTYNENMRQFNEEQNQKLLAYVKLARIANEDKLKKEAGL